MENLAAKLGGIVMNFNTLERAVCIFVSKLISNDFHIGTVVTSEMSFQNLMKCLDSLIKYKCSDDAVIQKWDALKTRLNTCEQTRNIYVHSLFMMSVDGNKTFRLKTTAKLNKGLKTDKELLDATKIQTILSEQASLIIDIQKFYKDLLNEEMKFVIAGL